MIRRKSQLVKIQTNRCNRQTPRTHLYVDTPLHELTTKERVLFNNNSKRHIH